MAMVAHKISTIRLIKLLKYSRRIDPFEPRGYGTKNIVLPHLHIQQKIISMEA
jgi:hypothetical protein